MIQLPLYLICTLLLSCQPAGQAPPKITEIPTSEEVEVDSNEISYVMGLFSPEEDPRFIQIPTGYADREGLYLREETLEAFIDMYEAARKDNITLQIRSATRNFAYQKGIWERKWTGETILSDGVNAATGIADPLERARKILEYSSMPGTSRHHWGTDIDLNAFNNSWFESGEGLILYNWMLENAAAFGFCQPYTKKDDLRPHGYNEEKWHWSYMPLSKPLTEFAEKHLSNELITGFMGAEQAGSIDVVNKYILGINQSCISHGTD